jgi:hypothetical protein
MSNNKSETTIFDSTKIPIAFSPNDFFYLTAGSDMPDESWCDKNKTNQLKCDKLNDVNVDICYQQELCKNRELADHVFTKRNTHGESDAKLKDIYVQYMNEYMKSINLGVGIILASAFIYYNK